MGKGSENAKDLIKQYGITHVLYGHKAKLQQFDPHFLKEAFGDFRTRYGYRIYGDFHEG